LLKSEFTFVHDTNMKESGLFLGSSVVEKQTYTIRISSEIAMQKISNLDMSKFLMQFILPTVYCLSNFAKVVTSIW
jgi:hypothetical protein